MVRLEVLVVIQLIAACLSQSSRDVTSTDFIFYNETLSCTAEIRNITGHTLCLTDNSGITKSGTSMDDKKLITDYHNMLRSKVEPPAEDLLKLLWDERVASVAQKWANQCIVEHDSVRKVPDLPMSIGQNVAAGHISWQSAIQRWYDEVRDFTWGQTTFNKTIGHYLQMVSNGTILIGCGFAECPETKYKRFYVCNYAEPYGPSISASTPYIPGTRCGGCTDYCTDGLCDCGGLICENRGELVLSSCTCACPKIYNGTRCEQVNCPTPPDPWSCSSWPDNYCQKYYNVPETCPYKCGICKSPCGDLSCENGGTLLYDSCTCACRELYNGTRCEQVKCPSSDGLSCTSWPDNYCQMFYNVPETCPYKCGICKSPCGDLSCENGGTLLYDSCTCACLKPYNGTRCEQVNCPTYDDVFCTSFPDDNCKSWSFLREDCPYKCGICERPCSGMICENDGTLLLDSCTCACRELFNGTRCEQVKCPPSDDWICPDWSENECQLYRFLRERCPFKCGLCQ